MDIKVIEGRLTEVRTDTGIERRAFGEFVSHRGEMASYAIGWTTGPGLDTARLTVGIGAGNPGGGSFHAVIFANEGGHAFTLTDEPYERVPEGGPDLTAAQARAHDTLPFVWWVADVAMERDRRAWWMRHWLLGTMCIQTGEVSERSEPILLVSHDADDGVWQLIGSSDADTATAKIGHLHHSIDDDQTLIDVLDLAPGHSATREGFGRPWIRHVP